MQKGNVRLGLVILGVVAIIAVVGLVLLFTRASSEGAAVSYGMPNYGDSLGGVGRSYTWGTERGLGETYPVPKVTGPGDPRIERPSPAIADVIRTNSEFFPVAVVRAAVPGSVASLASKSGV